MKELATTAWLDISLVLLCVVLFVGAVLSVFLMIKRNYWPLRKAPFWFEVLQMIAVINTGLFSSRLAQIYWLPLIG